MKTKEQIAGMSLFEIKKLVRDRDYWILEGRKEAFEDVEKIINEWKGTFRALSERDERMLTRIEEEIGGGKAK